MKAYRYKKYTFSCLRKLSKTFSMVFFHIETENSILIPLSLTVRKLFLVLIYDEKEIGIYARFYRNIEGSK